MSVHLGGCERQLSSSAKDIPGIVEKARSASSNVRGLPRCPGVNLSIVGYRYIEFSGANIKFRNDDFSGAQMGLACAGPSVSFGRKLMSDGAWALQSDLSKANAKVVAAAHVVIVAIHDRSFVTDPVYLSEIGSSESFDGIAFTKWTASPAKVSQFKRENPKRRVRSGPEWTVNGAVDDERNRPVNISCSPGETAEEQGDNLYMNLGRFGTSSTGLCQTWFGVDVGKDSRVIAKVAISGQVFVAAAMISHVKRDLRKMIEEVQFGHQDE